MRDLNQLNHWRLVNAHVLEVYGFAGDHETGVFMMSSCIDRKWLKVVAAAGAGWDHVSVSHQERIPRWREMSQIHRLFFKEDEVAMQLHVPAADHINTCDRCLHLWRPHAATIPLPPKWMVG